MMMLLTLFFGNIFRGIYIERNNSNFLLYDLKSLALKQKSNRNKYICLLLLEGNFNRHKYVLCQTVAHNRAAAKESACDFVFMFAIFSNNVL